MPDHPDQNPHSQAPSDANGPEAPAPETFHVLVVDDEEDVRDILCEFIRHDGYRVTGASSGPEALGALGKERFHLVLTDLMMPEMTGWQLLRRVKTEYTDIPVVVITGFISEQGESMLTNRQADAYLTKPVQQQRLQTLLRALLFPANLGRTAEVVVVDDDPTTLQAIEHVLVKRGLFVTNFKDPDEAQHHTWSKTPDLFIVDLLFPGASGFDLCRALRTDADTARTPILILTANPSRENVAKAIQLQVNGFLAKPFVPEELAERVLKLILQSGQS